uniref:Uncharacterized protein n=1 Tax=Candidatus Kentrum sp. FW TaxID=2126338 RepID=A0A450THK1_9GAMM|nr:MAG: hypothetical protein BECKFW1821B_GA0114236_111910 [Candidatus Kentron sp. FW]
MNPPGTITIALGSIKVEHADTSADYLQTNMLVRTKLIFSVLDFYCSSRLFRDFQFSVHVSYTTIFN